MSETSDNLTAFIENLSALPSHYHRAMVTHFDHAECWKGATRFYQLEKLIRNYFHRTESRSSHCVVEPFSRGKFNCRTYLRREVHEREFQSVLHLRTI